MVGIIILLILFVIVLCQDLRLSGRLKIQNLYLNVYNISYLVNNFHLFFEQF